METQNCCSGINNESAENTYELVRIKKIQKVCPMCEDFAQKQISKEIPFAIISCEGACLRGEIYRQVANLISFNIMPERASRICLGGAFTKNSGQRNLVKNSKRVIVLEGCYIECASRMMAGVIEDFAPEVIIVDKLYDFNKKLFAITDMSEDEIKTHAKTVANRVVERINDSL